MNSYMNSYQTLRNLFALIFIMLLVVGCTNKNVVTKKTNEGRYDVVQDYGPDSLVDVSHVKDVVPKVEPLSRGGNRSSYKVFGKTYNVLRDSKGYKERGGASWYGKKFHGHLTANGEKYDMFAMSAAHKSLPIPSYVKVTNLANQKQVIVRVNDRGPFHKGRVIDLSYAAASKLDMLKSGTAQVEVEVIDPITWNKTKQNTVQNKLLANQHKQRVVNDLANENNLIKTQTITQKIATQKPFNKESLALNNKPDLYKGIHYVQLGVYSTGQAARKVMIQAKELELPVLISEQATTESKLYKVVVGPMEARSQASNVIAKLEGLGFVGAHLVNLPR